MATRQARLCHKPASVTITHRLYLSSFHLSRIACVHALRWATKKKHRSIDALGIATLCKRHLQDVANAHWQTSDYVAWLRTHLVRLGVSHFLDTNELRDVARHLRRGIHSDIAASASRSIPPPAVRPDGESSSSVTAGQHRLQRATEQVDSVVHRMLPPPNFRALPRGCHRPGFHALVVSIAFITR